MESASLTSAPGAPGVERPRAEGRHRGILLGIVLVAAVVRLAWLTQAPPGLDQDEAANAWNAWCLLKTGHDQAGAAWPIFYTHALGENRSALFLYAILPFQAIGGLNVWTTRLPAALGGVVTVLLVYWIGARWFDRTTGLLAAALLALNPWHVQLSRWGYEASLTPLLVALAVAALIWAGLLPSDRLAAPRLWRWLAAGLIVGICCYGYAAVRLFLPPFLVACALLTWRRWAELVRRPGGATALVSLLVGIGVTFGPLAYQHWVHPELIARRAERIWLWQPDDSFVTAAGKVTQRYAEHFAPGFLFREGAPHEVFSPAGFGLYSWYALPLMLAGLVIVLRGVRTSAAARVVLCWVLLYPVGDCLHRHVLTMADGTQYDSLHVLRSAPGLIGLILLAAVGGIGAWRYVHKKRPAITRPATAVFVVVALFLDVRFLAHFFGEHNRQPAVYHAFHVDLMQACEWLRPRCAQADAVFITATDMNMPYLITLVGVGYDPAAWCRDEKEIRTFRPWEWEYYFRVGKFYFIYDRSSLAPLEALLKNGRPDHVIFIVRPGEVQLERPTHTIVGPAGETELQIYDVTL